MTKSVLACTAVSMALHGFLLSQWPSPLVNVPRWHATEPVEVTYLAPSPVPAVEHRPSPPAAPPRRTLPLPSFLRPPERLAAPRPAPPVPSAPSAPPPASLPAGVPRPAPPVEASLRPIPSLLTPGDFAQFRYKQMVRERLRRAIQYPVRTGAGEGAARLRLALGRDGRVVSAACLGAETPQFEVATMEGVAALEGLPPFPPEIADATLTYEFQILFKPGADTAVSS